MYYNNQQVGGKRLISDVITDRSIPLYAKLPCVDDPEWKLAFESIAAKIALPELELISIWGIVLVLN